MKDNSLQEKILALVKLVVDDSNRVSPGNGYMYLAKENSRKITKILGGKTGDTYATFQSLIEEYPTLFSPFGIHNERINNIKYLMYLDKRILNL